MMVVFLLAPVVCFSEYWEAKLWSVFLDHVCCWQPVFNRAQGEVAIRACSLVIASASHPYGSGKGSMNVGMQLQSSWFGGWNWQEMRLPPPPTSYLCDLAQLLASLLWQLVLTWLCDASQVLGEESS